MTAARLLARLAEIGATARRDGDRLVLRAGAVPIPKDVIATVRAHKAALLSLLATAEVEARCEREAIVEHDGGIPHAWAEWLAMLDPDHPPGDVPRRRWVGFVDAAGRFLDRWGAQAAALGWQQQDLFGADPLAPHARIDAAGLAWTVGDGKVVELTADAAVIETPAGARLTFRRV